MRISVSWLDSYRYWRDEDWMSLEALLAQMRGEEPPNPKMEAGTALHSLLEFAREGQVLDRVTVNGWAFTFDVDTEIALPPTRELKGTMVIPTPHGPCTLVGKVDAIGSCVIDYKLTEKPDMERYMDALQWRSYLAMFDGYAFAYEVFAADIDEDERTVRVKEHHRLPQYRYPLMLDDVRATVCELADLLVRRAPDLAARN